MERFLLLWDEMDDLVGMGRVAVGGALGAISEVTGATQRAASHVAGWTVAATAWVRDRRLS